MLHLDASRRAAEFARTYRGPLAADDYGWMRIALESLLERT
jgi:hypothetical protein